MTDALYKAAKDDSLRAPCDKNPQVEASIIQGLPDPLILSPRTPKDVITWIKEMHNEFHGGAGQTIMEHMERALDAQAAWVAELKRSGKTARANPSTGPGRRGQH